MEPQRCPYCPLGAHRSAKQTQVSGGGVVQSCPNHSKLEVYVFYIMISICARLRPYPHAITPQLWPCDLSSPYCGALQVICQWGRCSPTLSKSLQTRGVCSSYYSQHVCKVATLSTSYNPSTVALRPIFPILRCAPSHMSVGGPQATLHQTHPNSGFLLNTYKHALDQSCDLPPRVWRLPPPLAHRAAPPCTQSSGGTMGCALPNATKLETYIMQYVAHIPTEFGSLKVRATCQKLKCALSFEMRLIFFDRVDTFGSRCVSLRHFQRCSSRCLTPSGSG